MMKINKVGIPARDSALKGVKYAAEIIKSTIGPWGQNVALEKQNRITNDGYTIANELVPSIKDEFERRGAVIANEACSKTNDQAGDGTSTSWALTLSILNEAIRFLPKEGGIKAKKTPSEIREAINKSRAEVVAELEKMAEPIKSKEDLVKAALVSTEDEELAKLIGETQWDLGPDGIIMAEEVNETSCSIEKVKGIRLDNGFAGSHMINNPEKNSLELNDMPIFLTNYTIGAPELEILKPLLFVPLINQKKPGIILVARAFTPDAIKICTETLKAGFMIAPVNAPYEHQKEVMKDIEAVVGGRYIDTEEARLEDVHINDVGFVKRFTASQYDGTVTGEDNQFSAGRILNRVDELKKKFIGEKSDFYKKKLEARIAQLSSGFAILKVGSYSLANRKRLKDKADDAVNSTRWALKYGVVPGAGQAFKTISDKMDSENILKRPLTCVYDQITTTAPEGWTIPEWVKDPVFVLKTALTNACDVAAQLATINGQVVTENKKECYCGNQNNAQETTEVN